MGMESRNRVLWTMVGTAAALFAPTAVHEVRDGQRFLGADDFGGDLPFSGQQERGTLAPYKGGQDKQQAPSSAPAPSISVNYLRSETPAPEEVAMNITDRVANVFTYKKPGAGIKAANVQAVAKVGMSDLQKGLKGEAEEVAGKIRGILEKMLYDFVGDEEHFKYLASIITEKGFVGILDSAKEIKRSFGKNGNEIFDEFLRELEEARVRIDEISRVSVPMRAHVQKRVMPVAKVRGIVLKSLQEIQTIPGEIAELKESLKTKSSAEVVEQIKVLELRLFEAQELVGRLVAEVDETELPAMSFKERMLSKEGRDIKKVVDGMGRMLKAVRDGSRFERANTADHIAKVRSKVATTMTAPVEFTGPVLSQQNDLMVGKLGVVKRIDEITREIKELNLVYESLRGREAKMAVRKFDSLGVEMKKCRFLLDNVFANIDLKRKTSSMVNVDAYVAEPELPQELREVELSFEERLEINKKIDKKDKEVEALSLEAKQVMAILADARREQGLYAGERRLAARRAWQKSVVNELAKIVDIEVKWQTGEGHDVYDLSLNLVFANFKADFAQWLQQNGVTVEFKLPKFLVDEEVKPLSRVAAAVSPIREVRKDHRRIYG